VKKYDNFAEKGLHLKSLKRKKITLEGGMKNVEMTWRGGGKGEGKHENNPSETGSLEVKNKKRIKQASFFTQRGERSA